MCGLSTQVFSQDSQNGVPGSLTRANDARGPRVVGMWRIPSTGWCFQLDWAKAAAVETKVIGLTWERAWPHAPRTQPNDGIEVLAWGGHLGLRPSRVFLWPNTWLDDRVMTGALRRHARLSGSSLSLLHGHWYAGNYHMPRVASRLGIPYVHTEHSSSVTLRNPGKTMSRVALQPRRTLFREASVVIAVSEYLRDCILTNIGDCTTVVVPNPIDTSLFHHVASPDLGGSQPVTIINVGRLLPVKRQDMLLRAFKLLPTEPRTKLDRKSVV